MIEANDLKKQKEQPSFALVLLHLRRLFIFVFVVVGAALRSLLVFHGVAVFVDVVQHLQAGDPCYCEAYSLKSSSR